MTKPSASSTPDDVATAALDSPSSSTPVCVVTGGATGIGAACVQHFAAQGWNLAINNFGPATRAEADALAAHCRDAGGDALVVEADVREDADCRAMAATVLARWGRIDTLVNCAGITRFVAHADLDALDAAEFQRIYSVNLVGLFQATRACVPALRQRQGAVVNITSIAGINGTGSSIAYAASKGAANTLTLSLARALAPDVRVNAIAPGFVDDGLPSRVLPADQYADVLERLRSGAPLQRVCQPAEVAALAWTLAATPGMTGQVVVLDNGLALKAG